MPDRPIRFLIVDDIAQNLVARPHARDGAVGPDREQSIVVRDLL